MRGKRSTISMKGTKGEKLPDIHKLGKGRMSSLVGTKSDTLKQNPKVKSPRKKTLGSCQRQGVIYKTREDGNYAKKKTKPGSTTGTGKAYHFGKQTRKVLTEIKKRRRQGEGLGGA